MPKSNPEKDPIPYKSQYESEEKILSAARQKVERKYIRRLADSISKDALTVKIY